MHDSPLLKNSSINHLGGNVIHVDPLVVLETKQETFSCRETLSDTMKNISQWCDAIFARVYKHDTLKQMAEYAEIPVVNALCDRHHPMQALADMLTIQQHFGREKKIVITFIGDANNVAFSLIEIALKFGHEMRFTGPKNYYWNNDQLDYFDLLARRYNGTFIHNTNPGPIVMHSDVLYIDAFISMGEEHLHAEKINYFTGYQVNEEIFKETGPDTAFMHCLPAHRGVEVTDAVIDHPNSWVFKQAKNRMVASKGVFATLLTGERKDTCLTASNGLTGAKTNRTHKKASLEKGYQPNQIQKTSYQLKQQVKTQVQL